MTHAVSGEPLERALAQALSDLLRADRPRRLVVAFSGGADSTALLLAVAAARPWPGGSVLAFHFNHRLHPDSAAWVAHCREICDQLDVPLLVAAANDAPAAGDSIEAWARSARYAALADELAPDDLALTAHHRDDLAETLLLMALRGGGPHGLASIAPRRPLGAGILLRPLLELPQSVLRERVTRAGLRWLDDPANDDARLDRNFLRHEVMPRLVARWPAACANLAHAASLQRGAVELLDAYADEALAPVTATGPLDLAVLEGLPPVRQLLLLRRWLRLRSGHAPDRGTLTRVLREVVAAKPDARPLLAWRSGEIRRYRRALHWLPVPAPAPLAAPIEWRIERPLTLPGGLLSARLEIGQGVRASLLATCALTVRARQGGERLRPRGRAHSHSVKQLLQAAGVPPWERGALPLLHLEGQLIAVADLFVADDVAAGPAEAGIVFHYCRVSVPASPPTSRSP